MTQETAFPLSRLFIYLKAEGLAVNTASILEIQAVLATTDFSSGDIVTQIKYLVSPLICTSKEDQLKVERAFKKLQESLAAERVVLERHRRVKRIDFYKVVLFAFAIITIGLFFYFEYGIERWRIVGNTQTGADVLKGDTLRFTALSNKNGAKCECQLSWLLNDKEIGDKNPINYQFLDTGLYTLRVKIHQKNTDDLEAVLSDTIRVINNAELSVVSVNNIASRFETNDYSSSFALFLLIIVFTFYLFWIGVELYYSLKNRMEQQNVSVIDSKMHTQAPSALTNEAPFYIEFADHNNQIKRSKTVDQVKAILNKPPSEVSNQMDIFGTIQRTISSGGFPQIAYKCISRSQQFILLINKNHPQSFEFKLYQYLVYILANQTINIHYFYYYDDLNILFDKHQNLVGSAGKLPERFPNAILILCSQASELFNDFDVTIRPELQDYFDRWSKKAILTSKVRTQWGTQEFLLQKNGFVTFTTAFQSQDIQELNLLASITTETPGFAKNNSTPGRYLPIQISNLDDLYDYCDNNDLYRWICCLAIYPVIDWNLAIAIGNALQEKIADNKNKPLVSYDHLSQIARINWVIEGRIPDALKLAMLDELSDDLTIIARKCLSNLFNQFRNSITPKSYIKDEFEYLDQVNSFIIHTLTNDEVDPQLKSVINLYRKRRYLDSVSEQYLNGKFGLIKRDGIAISIKQYFENYQPNAKIAFHILGAPIRDWQLISYTAIVIFLFSVFNPNLFKNNDSHTYQFVLDSLLMENIKPDDIKLHINNTDQALVQYLNGIYHYEDFSPDITKVPVKIYIYYASGILRSKAFFLRSPDYKVSFSKPTTLNNLRPRKNDPSFSPQQQQQQQQEQPADTIKK